MQSRLWYFCGGEAGEFQVQSVRSIIGESLPQTPQLSVFQGPLPADTSFAYALQGVTSNERYLTQGEKTRLTAAQTPLGRQACRHGALIPIKKNQAWWELCQEERRRIFEEQSSHIVIGLRALPNISRRLHHCRDLASQEPFDFLTWFDFAEEDIPLFDDLLGALRATLEWEYVEREVELRVTR